MVKRIATRIADLEARILGPRRRLCPECGAADGGVVVTETRRRDGTVTYSPRPPCKGCDEIAAKAGRINHIIIRRAPTREELRGASPPEFFEVRERGNER